MSETQIILAAIIFISHLVAQVALINWMRTIGKWQVEQDKAILKLMDERKSALEREIAQLKTLYSINDVQGKIIKRLEP